MTAADSTETQRVRALRDELRDLFGKTEGDTVLLPIDGFKRRPLLRSQISLQQALDFVSSQTGGWLRYSVKKTPSIISRNGVSVTNPDSNPPIVSEPRPIAYEVWLADPKTLDEHFASLLKQKDAPKKSRSKNKPFYREVAVGDLEACSDGVIRFKGDVVEMRPQVISLCWVFMYNVGAVVESGYIKEKIISARKRELTSSATIAKYVSELHKILEKLYHRQVIFNVRENGWRFEPERKT